MKLIVMLIMLNYHFGPATISGFSTLAACRAAEPIVAAFYKKVSPTSTVTVSTECVELPK